MKHLINTLQLNITCSSESDAFSLQHDLAPVLQQQVAEAVESAARFSDPTELVIIDRIEIDMGTISLHTHEKVLATAIEAEMTRQLKPYLSPKPAEERNIARQHNTMELFRHFMLTGNLPWWAQSLEPDISHIFLELMDTNYNATLHFLNENRTSVVFWQRIVYQLNMAAKQKITDAIENINEAVILYRNATDTIQSAAYKDGDKILGEKKTRDVIVEEKIMLDMLLLEAPLFFNATSKSVVSEVLIRVVKKNIKVPGMKELLIEVEKLKHPGTVSATNKDTNEIMTGQATLDRTDLITTAEAVPENETMSPETTGVEKYFIQYAGIILLAPFLKTFFSRLQLLEEGQWKNSSACFKGIHLLRYLACGKTGSPEYELTLEKILCGLAAAIPVPAEVSLGQDELNEADSLLQSVIEHWKKLGNTSINGLRESFLKREGILSAKEGNWLLQVERKTMDVLLDSIPWGFSTTSLSWNNHIIFTEW